MIELFQGDCLELMKQIPDGSVDLVLCDLPYGTTACKWDTVIPFEPMWAQYRRVAKRNAAIVLTTSQPFTTALIASNMRDFKYEWVWDKRQPTGFLNAKKQPLRVCESVVVFYGAQCTYNPQMGEGKPIKRTAGGKSPEVYRAGIVNTGESSGTARYPTTLLSISAGRAPSAPSYHPTQKPVALMEYLIKTYTNPGDTVLDNCMGSGTTGVACMNTGRKFIGMEQDAKYFEIAQKRIHDSIDLPDWLK